MREFTLYDRLKLYAENDGDAYRDNRNAARAVRRAWWQYIKEQDDFNAYRDVTEYRMIRGPLIAYLVQRWNTEEGDNG